MSILNNKVLIGGGSGFVGQHLIKLLKNRGYESQIISRKRAPNQLTWERIKSAGIPPDITAVVNLAGHNIMDMTRRWSEKFKETVRNSRIDTTKLLAEKIETNPNVTAFVSISGVGIYEPIPNVEHSENSKVHDFDFFSRMCIDLEIASALKRDCRRIVVRSGVVLGKDGGMIKNLYLPFFLGVGGPIAPGNQFLPWIHIQDLTRLILHCIEHPACNGIVNGVAPQIVTNLEFSRAFGKALSRPALFTVPRFVLETMLSAERAKILTTGPKVLAERAERWQFEFVYPDIESACKAIIHSPAQPVF